MITTTSLPETICCLLLQCSTPLLNTQYLAADSLQVQSKKKQQNSLQELWIADEEQTSSQPAGRPARTCVRAREREKTRGNSGQQTIWSFRRPPDALPGVLQVVAVGMNSKRQNLRALWFWMTYFIQLSWGQYFIHYCLGWQILKLPYLPKTDVRHTFVFIYFRK